MVGLVLSRWKLKTALLAAIMVILIVSQSFAQEPFSDISGHWSEDVILWGYHEGIVKGYPDGTFQPERIVSEAEFLAMFFRTFTIVPKVDNPHHWADGVYKLAEKLNYPIAQTMEERDQVIDRTKVAEIVSSAYGVHYNGEDAIQFLLGNELARGKTDEPTLEGYAGEDNLTRAEAVQFLKNLLEKGKDVLEERPVEPSPRSELPPLPGDSDTGDTNEGDTDGNRTDGGNSSEDENTSEEDSELNENQEALVKIADDPDKLDSYGDLLKFVQLLDHYEALKDEVRPANNFDNYLLIGNEGKYGDNLSISYSDTYGSNLYVDIHVFDKEEEAILKDIFKVYYPNEYEKAFNFYLEQKKKPIPSQDITQTFDNRKLTIGRGISGVVSCVIEVKADE